MERRPRENSDEFNANLGELRTLVFQLRGFAYLLSQRQNDPIPPQDLEELHWGIGTTLDHLARKVGRITRRLEKQGFGSEKR